MSGASPSREPMTASPSAPDPDDGTRDVVLVDIRRPRRRIRRAWTFLALPLLFALAVPLAVRELSRVERTLASERDRVARVVVYEVAPGGELRFPLEPGTDVLRVVVHAVRKGALAAAPHPVTLTVALHGDRLTREETLPLVAPSTRERVTPEDVGLAASDPVGVDVDTHDVGVGDATVRVDRIDGADSLFVRVYRRESLHETDALRRGAAIGPARRARLARRSGEIDWIDLDDAEQAALVASRWRKVGALPGSGELVTRAIALGPPPPPAALEVGSLGAFPLAEGERVAVRARGPVTLVASGPTGARVGAIVHDAGRARRELGATGEVTVDVPADAESVVEVALDAPGAVTLRASDPARVELPRRAPFWRATPSRPAIVEAGEDGLVVRVSARRPLPRTEASPVTLGLVVALQDREGKALGEAATMRATVARSAVDRYEGEADAAPSERAVFYVVVPPRARASLSPPDGALDLILAELDPRPARSDDAASRAELFVPRAPTNARELSAVSGALHIAPAVAETAADPAATPVLRVKPTHRAGSVRVGRRRFEPIDGAFAFDLPGNGPVLVPVRVLAKEPVDLVVRVDGDAPRRRAGAATRVTTVRAIAATGEVHATLLLGDDLAPGAHTLRFEAKPGARAWVHLPWMSSTHRRPVEPHWVEGDFDP